MIDQTIPRTVTTPVPHLTDGATEADIVAEGIEAGYDEQADAATLPMSSDPASSRYGEVETDQSI